MRSYKGFCPNCGGKLQITYAKNGVMVMFCPHVPAHVVQTGIGQMKHMEIYCNNGIGKKPKPQQPKPKVKIEVVSQ